MSNILILLILIVFFILLFTKKTEENFSCTGETCCPDGEYGDGTNTKCQKCPESKPFSITGDPDKRCNCPNMDVNSCFAASPCSKCKTWDYLNKECVDAGLCKTGETCRVKKGVASCCAYQNGVTSCIKI